MSLREIARTTNLGRLHFLDSTSPSRETMRQHWREDAEPLLVQAGKPTMPASEEETMVVERLILAAKRGFAADKDS